MAMARQVLSSMASAAAARTYYKYLSRGARNYNDGFSEITVGFSIVRSMFFVYETGGGQNNSMVFLYNSMVCQNNSMLFV